MPETKALSDVATRAPHWAALIIVVGLFLFYMDRSLDSQEALAEQRIEVCHAVQRESNAVMGELRAVLSESSVSNALLIKELEEMKAACQKCMER